MGAGATAARNPICLSGLAADLWPHTARLEADGDISIGGLRLSAPAARYGTPACILDEADVRARCRAYADAVRKVFTHPELELVGLHCHLGSQITRPQAYELAARRLVRLMAAVRNRYGVTLAELNLGGGHAVPYLAGDEPFDLPGFADRIRRVVRAECAAHRLPVPRLTIEPGRAIISRAITLYRVLAVKHSTAGRVLVAVDGGMRDNPRPAPRCCRPWDRFSSGFGLLRNLSTRCCGTSPRDADAARSRVHQDRSAPGG